MIAEISVLKTHKNGKKHSQLLMGIKSRRQTLMSSFTTPAVETDKNIQKKKFLLLKLN